MYYFPLLPFVSDVEVPGANPDLRVPPPYNNRGTRFTLKQIDQKTGVFDL